MRRRRWEQIITAEIVDVNSGIFGLVDDLLIDASVVAIDGPGQCWRRPDLTIFAAALRCPTTG